MVLDRDDPAPLKPVYWCDRDVTLYEGKLQVEYTNQLIDFEGAIVLEWNPTPRITWRGSAVGSPSDAIHAIHGEESDWPSVITPSAHHVPAIPPRRGTRRPKPLAGPITASGPCDGLEFRTGDDLDRVDFNLINGPSLAPLAPLQGRRAWWLGRWRLEDESWEITLDSRPDLPELIKHLSRTRRHAFTHTGRITRRDGDPFTTDVAQSVLENLFLFLTFARGSAVGIALATGYRGKQPVWCKFTTGISSPYTGHFSWLDPHRPADAAAVWPRLVLARQNPTWNEALGRAIRHYAEAVPARSAEVSLILAETGMELLATAVMVDRDGTYDLAKWDSKAARWRLRKALTLAEIDLRIPNRFTAIRSAAAQHGWADAVDAVTSMRHTIAHWTTGKPKLDAAAWVEARQLAEHLFELLLLWALGYSGAAFNRLERPVTPGTARPVPWAASANRPSRRTR